MTMITVQVELRHGESAVAAARLIRGAAEYMELVERLPEEGKRWAIAGRVFVHREDFGEEKVDADACDHPVLRRTQYDLANLERCPRCGDWTTHA